MKRTIYLPAVNRRVTLGAYIAGIRLAKANPDREFRHGLTTWWPVTGAEILAEFRRGINDRINAGIPYSERGRSRSEPHEFVAQKEPSRGE